VGWYLRFSLSYRDVEELVRERGLSVDHVTVWRWVQRYAPEIERRLRPHLKPTNKSWRVDETYIRVKGKWTYLYRAVDSTGASIRYPLGISWRGLVGTRLCYKTQHALCDCPPSRDRLSVREGARVCGACSAHRGRDQGTVRVKCLIDDGLNVLSPRLERSQWGEVLVGWGSIIVGRCRNPLQAPRLNLRTHGLWDVQSWVTRKPNGNHLQFILPEEIEVIRCAQPS
jgi:DDE domain